MARYVALLRGINLGRQNRVSLAKLRELLAALGDDNVTMTVRNCRTVTKLAELAAG